MITPKQLKYIRSCPKDKNGQITPRNNNPDEKTMFNMYNKRIQQNIEKNFEGLITLCIEFPELLLNEENKFLNKSVERKPNRRMKELYRAIMLLNPKVQVELSRKDIDF